MRTTLNTERPFGRINNKEHLQVSREIATEGIVLLKNENDFFPINPSQKITIVVIGENAIKPMTIGGGSSELKADFEISPLEGLQKRYKNATIIYSKGYSSDNLKEGEMASLNNEAIEMASKADLVLFFGGLNKNKGQDCEDGDRQELNLPYNQDYLISEIQKENANIGIVLVSGNAVSMPWISRVKAVMQTWYLGSEAGHAIADIISGDVNPSGKLPFSFPVKLTDNAAHFYGEISYPGDGKTQHYKDDIFVGYRWHDTKNIKPLFSFGHGLSYTSFKLSDIKTNKKTYTATDRINIMLKLTNIGNMDGSEVVQVYIGKPESKVTRALKELKGFKKIFLKKSEHSIINIPINVASLSFYDASISNWNLEKGDYTIYIGNASNNISKKISITIE
jgi:beta-glucosidase